MDLSYTRQCYKCGVTFSPQGEDGPNACCCSDSAQGDTHHEGYCRSCCSCPGAIRWRRIASGAVDTEPAPFGPREVIATDSGVDLRFVRYRGETQLSMLDDNGEEVLMDLTTERALEISAALTAWALAEIKAGR